MPFLTNMKYSLILSFLLLCFSLRGNAQTQQITNMKFFDGIINKDWSSAEKCLSDIVKVQLKDGGLKKAFGDIALQIGDLKSVDSILNSTGNKNIYRYIAHFEKEALTLQIAGNDSLKISGFYLLPLTAAYTKPTYASSSKSQEQRVSIPSGNIKLKGVYTSPRIEGKDKYPLIVLIGGSGPTDEDETIVAEKPFKDIALGLAVQGIATLRFAKRTHTFPEKSKENVKTIFDEYSEDVKNVISFSKTMPNIDTSKVIILGHSLGGMLAPLLLKQNPSLAGAILLEANARPLEDLISDQLGYLSQFNKNIPGAYSPENIRSEVAAIKSITPSDSVKTYLNVKGTYWLSLKTYAPLKTVKSINNKKLLIIQGGKDYQVTEIDYLLWKKAIGSRPNATFKFYPKITHAIVETESKPSPADYMKPLNVPYYVISDIAAWLIAKQ
jgi:esterase/lipase